MNFKVQLSLQNLSGESTLDEREKYCPGLVPLEFSKVRSYKYL